MGNMFGGGFTAPPGSVCKLRGQQPQGNGFPQQAQTVPVRQLGVVPVQAPVLGVVPPQNQVQAPPVQAVARPVAPQSPVGPASYPVMKKGEAPCPVCR